MQTLSDSAKVKAYKNRVRVCIVGALAFFIQSQLDAGHAQSTYGRNSYSEYVNQRYNYSICYPDNIFIPQGESISGDGQAFRARDGAELRVYAGYNVDGKRIEQDFKDTVAGESAKGVVTFQLQVKNWYVVSGKSNGNIFYRKTVLDGDEFITFRAVYPESANALYAEIVTALSKCLKPAGQT